GSPNSLCIKALFFFFVLRNLHAVKSFVNTRKGNKEGKTEEENSCKPFFTLAIYLSGDNTSKNRIHSIPRQSKSFL
ncbi:MAG: hypothetical protein IJF71_02120, partial [Clostridia bacterium]|nr:hypothetical protein [Clostridia bacterium]